MWLVSCFEGSGVGSGGWLIFNSFIPKTTGSFRELVFDCQFSGSRFNSNLLPLHHSPTSQVGLLARAWASQGCKLKACAQCGNQISRRGFWQWNDRKLLGTHGASPFGLLLLIKWVTTNCVNQQFDTNLGVPLVVDPYIKKSWRKTETRWLQPFATVP